MSEATVTERRVDCESVGGIPLPAGTRVTLCIGAANRDPAVWEAPDRFDITRPAQDSARHLSSGYGSSSCLGGGMSRRILGHLLGALVEHLAELSAARRRQRFPEFTTRDLTALPASPRPGDCARSAR